ncbi:MAG: Major facilitator family transporter [Candidatus Tokpelaia hoelldobleri]|uniref:Major facilitator family transporter n=1 Tax=Candidatus Tokpelaia hoelldobleri TaxID=1902579 RepID=A0A1U9JTW6_9HYPH|nr:MAG: Major facilitator family transporter [Candidatus Tokpelaia hoelldoblerii]
MPDSHSPHSTARSWLTIAAPTATAGVVGAAIGLGAQLVSALMEARGYSNTVIGYNGTFGGIATIIAAACTPHIARHFGVVRPILVMLIVGGSSFLGFYWFQNQYMWFGLRFTLHFAMTVMFILSEFWVNSAAPPQRRGQILALYAMTLGLGFCAGPLLFSFVGSQGFLPFGIGCTIIALAAIPVIAAWNLSPRFRDSERVPFLHYIFKVPTSTMAVFIYGAIQLGAVTLLLSFSIQIGYTEEQSGHFMLALALGSVLLLVPLGMISDHINDRRYTLLGCALIGFGGSLLAPAFYHNPLALTVILFVLGGVSAGLYTIGLAQLGARLKGHELAAANSAFIFCYGVGMVIGPTLIGQAMDWLPQTGFALAMATFFGLYVILVVLRLIKKLFFS